MAEVKDNFEKDKLARDAFEKEVEKARREGSSLGSGKGRKLGPGSAHMMDYEMGDQHQFHSPEFSGEYERMLGGGSKR
jgi:COP9 signalosome complex subunit 7